MTIGIKVFDLHVCTQLYKLVPATSVALQQTSFPSSIEAAVKVLLAISIKGHIL